MGTVLGVLCMAAAPARAQDGGIVLEGGTARSLPPSGAGLDAATYAMGGVRVEWGSPRGSFSGGVYGGQATDDAGSDFLSGTLGGEFWLTELGPVAFGVGGMVQGFAVKEPFYYRVAAAEVSPEVRFGSARASLVIRGRMGAGTSRVELRRDDRAVRRADHDLWSRGVEAELSIGSSAFGVTAFTGVHSSSGGDFRGGGCGRWRWRDRWPYEESPNCGTLRSGPNSAAASLCRSPWGPGRHGPAQTAPVRIRSPWWSRGNRPVSWWGYGWFHSGEGGSALCTRW